MGEVRIDKALERLSSALTRIEVARDKFNTVPDTTNFSNEKNAERVSALVNRHEKLREEVADTLRDLELLISEHES